MYRDQTTPATGSTSSVTEGETTSNLPQGRLARALTMFLSSSTRLLEQMSPISSLGWDFARWQMSRMVCGRLDKEEFEGAVSGAGGSFASSCTEKNVAPSHFSSSQCASALALP